MNSYRTQNLSEEEQIRRAKKIVELKDEDKLSFETISTRFDISSQRISAIYHNWKKTGKILVKTNKGKRSSISQEVKDAVKKDWKTGCYKKSTLRRIHRISIIAINSIIFGVSQKEIKDMGVTFHKTQNRGF